MSTTKGDPAGTAVGFVLGALVGIGLAYPAIPMNRTVFLAGIELGPAETFLLVGVLVVVSLPVLFVVLMTVIRS